jgi:hypothetical protein
LYSPAPGRTVKPNGARRPTALDLVRVTARASGESWRAECFSWVQAHEWGTKASKQKAGKQAAQRRLRIRGSELAGEISSASHQAMKWKRKRGVRLKKEKRKKILSKRDKGNNDVHVRV